MNSREINIIKSLAWTEFKLKYSRSAFGFGWSLLKPGLMLSTLYIVFSLMINLNIKHYPFFLLLGIILWNFFSEATSNGLKSLSSKSSLIKKCVFSKRIIVVSTCLSAAISFLINLAVFFVIILIFRIPLSWHAASIPFFVILLFILTLGMSYLLSVLYLRFKDLDHIWEVLLQIGFWITPIVYSLSVIPEEYKKWYILNPLGRIINDSRDAILFNSLPSMKHITITVVCCLLVYAVGRIVFMKNEKNIGELV